MDTEDKNKKRTPQKHLYLLGGITLALLVVFGFGVMSAYAVSFEDPSTTLGLGTADLKETVINIINWALGLLGLVAVILIIYGGYTWLTAAGDEDRIRRAKRIIVNALIGMIIILLAWAIVRFVLDFGNNVTNPGGGQCSPEGAEQGCWDCAGGQWVYDGSNASCTGLPGPDEFEIRNIVTSCETPPNYRQDVFRCSAVTVVFNRVLNVTTVEQNTLNDNLLVEECDASSDLTTCNNPSQPTPLFNALPGTLLPPAVNEIDYSGSAPKGDRAEIVAGGKAFTFLHAQEEFKADTFYRLKIPKADSGIKDTTDKPLTGCAFADGTPIPGCDGSAATYFSWIFQVGDQNDPVAPTLVSSYPVFSTGSGYPDRNVNRTAVLSAQFSEAIAPWTITEDNIKVYGFDAANQPDASGNGGTRSAASIDGAAPAPDNYDVFINSGGNGFELKFINGFQLDAFRWYEIEVNNLIDLCSNVQTPAPITWRFETNGVGAGIANVYPPDGFQFACPNTEVFVRFNTSMYDPATSSCIVDPSVGGYVTGGAAVPPRNPLQVEDAFPGGSANPNNYCKKYSWQPASSGLNPNTNFSPSAQTRYQIDQSGTTLSAAWNFRTAAADSCANPPVITQLSPDTGPAGACLSVIGNYFDPNGNNQGPADNDQITFSGNNANNEIKRWSQRAIVVNAPNSGSGPSPVQVTVNYPAPIGNLQSNTLDFNYVGGSFSGACLVQLNPDSGLRNQGYQLIGEDFDVSSSTKLIHFGTNVSQGNWSSDTVANSSVPPTAPFGVNLVSLENDAGRSNELPFDVMSIPPATFQLVDFTPNCSSACTNANVRARFSQSLTAASITNNTIELYRCADATCALGGLTEVTTTLNYPGGLDVTFPQTGGLVVPDVWYRAIVRGGALGVKSANGLELGNLNFDSDGAAGNDSSSWTFKTSSSTEQCTLTSVACQPGVTSVPVGGTRAYQGFAYSDPNSCNPGGEELDPWAYTWGWSSNDGSRVAVSPASPDPVTTSSGIQATLPGTPVQIQAAAGGENAQCAISVTTNTCVTDADCTDAPTAGSCPGSQCQAGVCSPVITDVSPNAGAVGDWLTVSGCYFDSYVDGQSQVQFLQDASNPDLTGLWPLPSVCGAPGTTWQDRQIVVEVPNKRDGDTNDADDVRVVGPLRVIRGSDTAQVDSAETFTPSGQPNPGICRVTPGAGQAGIASLRIQGQNFGPAPASANDRVIFYDGSPAGSAVAGIDTTWVNDGEVKDVDVPQSALNNPGTSTDLPWTGNASEIVLENESRQSNVFNFDVIPPSCSICASDTQCGGGGTSQGCGASGPFQCCGNRPVASALAPTNPPATCRNAQIAVGFTDSVTGAPVAMDRSTITPATVRLRNLSDGVDVALNASDFLFPTASTFQVNPGLLLANKNYQVTVVGDENIAQNPAIAEGVLSTSGVGMFGSKVWSFTTADTVCQLDRVVLSPDQFLFTAFNSSQAVTALTYDQNGQPMSPVPGVYDWSWTWTADDDQVADVTTSNSTNQTITSQGNGTTVIRATATGTAGWSDTKTGTASARVNACVTPWPALPPYIDPLGPSTNYSTWYCRDQGSLPAVNPVAGTNSPITSGVDELLRQFFFENPNVNPATAKNDAIGMLIWENEGRLSPAAWYEKKFGERANGAIAKTDGYESLRVGTTVYIAGTNLSGSTLYTNMYVLGYNDDAGSEITAIFNQMLTNLKLNINSSSFAYAGTDALTALEQVRRDTDRVGDIMDYASALDAYEAAKGGFPTLPAGSYITDMSTSVWPSWSETFGTKLREGAGSRAVSHVDPLNDLLPACTAPYSSTTCWDEIGKKFSCPANSHIYGYQAANGGSTYDLFAHLEYLGAGSSDWVTGLVNPCSSPSSCGCFNFQLNGVSGGGGGAADLSPPSIPPNLAASAASANDINLTWTLSTDTGGSGVQSYELVRSLNGTSFGSPFAVVAEPTNSLQDSGLAADTTYYYKVRARDFAGNVSAYSNVAQARTQTGSDLTPSGNVSALVAAASDVEVTLTWTDPTDSDYAGVAVYRKNGSGGTFSRNDPAATLVNGNVARGTETIDVAGLTNGQAYTFGIFSFDGVPNYANGAFATATPSAGAYAFNVNAVAAAAGDASVNLTWVNPVDPGYVGVRIRRSTTGFPADPLADGTLVADITKPGTLASVGPLVNGTLYYFTLFAYDASRYASGVQISATPQAGSFADNVTNFVAVPGNAQVLLTWQNSSNPNYQGVKILRKVGAFPSGPNDGSATTVADVAKPGVQFSDTGVVNGTTYFYGAYAHDGVPNYGSGAFTQATPDDGPPGITGVTAPMVNIDNDRVRILWQSTEPADGRIEIGTDPTQYELGSFLQGGYTTVHTWDSAAAGLVLQQNVKYHFRVSGTDPAGNGTTDIDHTFVTDFTSASGVTWEGYFETLLIASWNGEGAENDNQYYSCSAQGLPDCSDPRNSSQTCAALAFADCLDTRADLPQGSGALTSAALAGWVGTQLPTQAEYQTTCSGVPASGMPYGQGVWSSEQAPVSFKARHLGIAGGSPSCSLFRDQFVQFVSPFIIISL